MSRREIIKESIEDMIKQNRMQRSRAWERVRKEGDQLKWVGLKYELGEENGQYVEDALLKGGVIAEIGAGNLVAARHLAFKYPQGKVIAIESYPNDVSRSNMSSNITLLEMAAEDLTPQHLPYNSLDACFSAYVLTYVQDKIGHIAHLWKFIKPGGRLIVHAWHSPTTPSFDEIMEKHGYADLARYKLTPNMHPEMIVLHKPDDRLLDFGNYRYEADYMGHAMYFTRYYWDRS